MRKRIIRDENTPAAAREPLNWLNIERLAEVEITSEDPEHPIDAALAPAESSGWRAAEPGEQKIRIVFDEPQPIRRIQLVFDENENERTQEFVLGWSADRIGPVKDIVRQQYNFSPPATTRELEDYRVNLPDVAAIELRIKPDISGGPSRASLHQLRLS
jgi:hypothetical protein